MKNIISFKELYKIDKYLLNTIYEEKKNRILQYSRVKKYIKKESILK